MTKEMMTKLIAEAMYPVVDAIAAKSTGIYETIYDKLCQLPEEERDQIVANSIELTARQIKHSLGMLKEEDILKNLNI